MTGRAARVVAQCKVNLGLRVLSREQGGYHSIETVFARLTLADRVTVRIAEGAMRSLECGGPRCPPEGLGPAERNLAFRAALAYAQVTGWPPCFTIAIQKHIPVSGGLGGGSADAGATLRALNALAPEPLEPRDLLRVAGSLGADVPFLTSESSLALAWGRGERLLPLPALPERHVALVVPAFGVSTADAYRWLDDSRAPHMSAPVMLPLDALTSWEGISAWTANELEPVVALRHPRVRELADALRSAGASIAGMTGSGSVVFGIFDAPTDSVGRGLGLGEHVLWTRTATSVAPVEMVEADSASG